MVRWLGNSFLGASASRKKSCEINPCFNLKYFVRQCRCLTIICNIVCHHQRRSRSVEVFGQFGGQSCTSSIGDREYCTTPDVCTKPPAPECSDTEFQCESGTSTSFKSSTVAFSFIILGPINWTPIFTQVRVSRRDYCATGTMTARMDQMRTVMSLRINPVVRKSWKAVSKAGQQDMGKSESLS